MPILSSMSTKSFSIQAPLTSSARGYRLSLSNGQNSNMRRTTSSSSSFPTAGRTTVALASSPPLSGH
ncbi:unnamed protein product [Cuscuta campestris]|uniref:Uncharacterized protein n=1 Tax=Cuscuta campestris TaxID=132261 RepID=A0A484LGY1_9ASTE|nr:unnamed protein product [Cuscuta campestris]